MKAKKKPEKPRPDFPLFPHGNGQWAKKIRGKMHYFGLWDNPEAALSEYLDVRDELMAGRVPRKRATPGSDEPTVVYLCNRFMNAKLANLNTGELSQRMFEDYKRSCERVIEFFGKDRLLSDITTQDFQELRTKLAGGQLGDVGLVTLGNRIRNVRIIFRFAEDADIVDRAPKFGPGFKMPSRKNLRTERNAKPAKMFQADQLRTLIDKARPAQRAQILLAINCGFGNTDISSLPLSAVNLKTGWINFPRPKTGIQRRCPLWKETVQALAEVLKRRKTPADDTLKDLVFITKQGHRYVRPAKNGVRDGVSSEFAKLLKDCDLVAPGRGFYAIRHTFETIGGESKDQVAVDWIMGHAPASDDMAAAYREGISDKRLKAVTDCIRKWLELAAK